MSNFSFEPLKLKLATNNIIIPMENGVADLTNAETSAKIMLAGKELFPVFDERIGGRNLIKKNAQYHTYGTPTFSYTQFDNKYCLKVQAGATRSGVFTREINNQVYIEILTGDIISYSFKVYFETSGTLEYGYQNSTTTFIDMPAKVWVDLKVEGEKDINDNRNIRFYSKDNAVFYVSELKIEKGNKATDWTPAPEDVLQLSTLSSYNCSAAIVGDLVKITSHTPDTKRGWVDVTVNYGNLSNTKRLNWSVEGVEPYKPLGTLLTMNNRGIKY